MDPNNQNLQQIHDDEIDLAEVIRQIWAGRWIILITTAIFILMAILYLLYNSYSGPREYESQTTLMVESPSPDSLISILKSPLFLSEALKIKLTGLKPEQPLTVAEFLNQQTRPPQGNLAGLTNRINAVKGSAGILAITVKMQDQHAATQLTDSVVRRLTLFLRETQVKRAAKSQELLVGDTARNFQLLRESTSRNLLYLSKGSSNNIQFLTEGSANEIQYLSKENVKNIQFQNESLENQIQSQNEGSLKSIQFLSEGYIRAESTYMKSQQALADYYTLNSKNQTTIDSIEVKRLNSDIKLKYKLYSDLYQQLEQAKINAKDQSERVKINAEMEREKVKRDADKKIEQTKINNNKQLEQAKIDANKQLEQAKIDANKQLEQAKIDAENQMEKVTLNAEKNLPIINTLESASNATLVNVPKTKKIMLVMVFLGITVGIIIVFGKKFYDKNFAAKHDINDEIV